MPLKATKNIEEIAKSGDMDTKKLGIQSLAIIIIVALVLFSNFSEIYKLFIVIIGIIIIFYIKAAPTKDVSEVISSRLEKKIDKEKYKEKIEIIEQTKSEEQIGRETQNNLYSYLVMSLIDIEKTLRGILKTDSTIGWKQMLLEAKKRKIISADIYHKFEEIRKLRNNLVHGEFNNIDRGKLSHYIEVIETLRKELKKVEKSEK